MKKNKISMYVAIALGTMSVNAHALPGEKGDKNEVVAKQYETRYELVDGGPLSYTDENGRTSNKYPPEALAYLFMHGPSVLNSDVIAGIATFKLNSSTAEYFYENLPENNQNDVTYSPLANRWLINGKSGTGLWSSGSNTSLYTQNLDANRAAYLTGAPTLAQSRAMNAGQRTKVQLLKYLNNQKLQHMNFDFEQQFDDISCNMDGFTANCYNNGVKRILATFKIAAGQDVNAEGTFYGLKVEEDPDKGSTSSGSTANPPSGNIAVKYYSDVIFPDFYLSAVNREHLKNYEPNRENSELTQKLAYQYYGWLEGTFNGANMGLNERVNTFNGVLPLALSVVSNKDGSQQAVDITDKYGTVRNSLNNSSQCFFGNGQTCIVDAKTLMIEKNAKTLQLTEFSPFILSKIDDSYTEKQIDFDRCLQPKIKETSIIYASVDQYKIVKEFTQQSNGEISLNTIQPLSLNASVRLPEGLRYEFNTSFNRNEYVDGRITDELYSKFVFNPLEATLKETGEPQVFNLTQPFNSPNLIITGNTEIEKTWSCEDTFGNIINEQAQRYQNYCGNLPSVTNIHISENNGYCKATMSVNFECDIKKDNLGNDIYSWKQQENMNIILPEEGQSCTETCYPETGPKTQGYCTWRETSTGRKYKS